MSTRQQSGEAVAAQIIVATLQLSVIALCLFAMTVGAMGKELFRVYQENARGGTGHSRFLWWALGVLATILLLCTITAILVPPAGGACLLVMAWSFLAYVLAVEGCDWYVRKRRKELEPDWGDLDTFLDWSHQTQSRPLGTTSKNEKHKPLSIG